MTAVDKVTNIKKTSWCQLPKIGSLYECSVLSVSDDKISGISRTYWCFGILDCFYKVWAGKFWMIITKLAIDFKSRLQVKVGYKRNQS